MLVYVENCLLRLDDWTPRKSRLNLIERALNAIYITFQMQLERVRQNKM